MEGEYPTVVDRGDGRFGLVVQDYWFGKFLGFLQVNFSKTGDVLNWTGNPILLDSSIDEDKEMLSIIDCYKDNVTQAIAEVIGYTKVLLEQADNICRLRECNLGNLIADAFFFHYADMDSNETGGWSDVNGAVFNGGGIRAPIEQYSNITMGHILATMPFGQSVIIMTINGSELKAMFEHSVSAYGAQKKEGRFLQVSGFRVKYNVGNPNGCRVDSLEVLCRKCKVPRYEAVNECDMYKVVTSDYVARGGDGYKKATNATSGGPADFQVLVDHIKKMTPIKTPLEERIIIYNSSERVKIPGDNITDPKEPPAPRMLLYYPER